MAGTITMKSKEAVISAYVATLPDSDKSENNINVPTMYNKGMAK